MEHLTEEILKIAVLAVGLGILAQVTAHRFRLPAILPLLVYGMAAGPFGFGLFDPETLGPGLEALLHLGVAVILFEGGLSLDIVQLRQVSKVLRNLLFWGTVVTAIGGAVLARWFLDLSWPVAALFGAIVTVTGPTVIVPLLRHMVAPQRVRTLLLSEGLMIDPIGAVLAYMVLQWIERANLGLEPLAMELLTLAAIGSVVGFVAGSIAALAVRHRHLGDELRNLVILAVLLVAFYVSELYAPQSGILASVVMGLTLSAAHLPDLNPLKIFKEQLTVLIISILFILLSAGLDLGAVYRLGWRGLVVVAGLILVVRPLAVFFAAPGSSLDWKSKVVLAFTSPRGIVAAAVASLSAIQLRESTPGAEPSILEGLVYLVILASGAWATVMAKVLPRVLGYVDDPSRRRAILVGGHALSAGLAEELKQRGWTPVVVDAVDRRLAPIRERHTVTVIGDARDASIYEDAGIERDSYVLALTTNDALNLLVAELVREEFGVEHPVVALQQPSSEFGQVRRAWVDLLGGRSFQVGRWIRHLDEGKAELLTVELDPDPEKLRTLRGLLRDNAETILPVCRWVGDRPGFSSVLEKLEEGDTVTLLVTDGAATKLEGLMRRAPVEGEEGEAEPEAEEIVDGGEAQPQSS